MLLHAFLSPLLVLSELLFLTVVQERLDFAARVVADALDLGHLVFPGQRAVLTQRLHLLLLVGKDGLDLSLLIRGQTVALGHVRDLFIRSHVLVAAPLSLTIRGFLSGRIGCGVFLLRKSGSRAKGKSSG